MASQVCLDSLALFLPPFSSFFSSLCIYIIIYVNKFRQHRKNTVPSLDSFLQNFVYLSI